MQVIIVLSVSVSVWEYICRQVIILWILYYSLSVFLLLIFLIVGLAKPEHHILNKLPLFEGKNKNVRRWLVVGYYFAAFSLLSVVMAPFLPEEKSNINNHVLVKGQEPKVKEEQQFVTIKTADDTVLTRYKNIYNKLMSFKNSPDFHFHGFGTGGKYHGWYMATQNFTEEEDLHLVQTYGIVSGDLLMLGQEYLKSQGQETDFSRNKREELEKIFSSETWEVLK